MALGTAAIAGLLLDAAMGGLTFATAFREFRKGRDPGETEEQAAAEFVKLMLAEVTAEKRADDAIDAWLAKHG